MKKLAITSLIVLIFCTSCKTFYPVSDAMNDSLLITVDCRNQTGTKQSVVMLFRIYKARDLKVTTDQVGAESLSISAAFLKRELPQGKLTELMHEIENLGGVIESRVEENHRAVMQTADFVPAR
jgi:hypothetical protein